MGQNVAFFLVVIIALGSIHPPEVDAQICFYYLSSIRSQSISARTYYSYTAYYYTSCGWWGWRRCQRSYSVTVYYTYYYTRYDVFYIQQHYCCWGYSGANCDPICYYYCGHCSGCVSPYYCSCNSGWTGSTCCSDYNECLYGNGGCEQNCHNTVGSYYCSCGSGYTKVGSHCIDINECLSNNGGCSDSCHNTQGGYYCSCPDGYNLVGGTCYDIIECNNNNGGCQQNCINQAGTYHCTCNEGFDLSSDKHNCDDHNECTNGEANCNHHCVNTQGGYYCYCNSGYELDIDDETCIDTNECLNNNGGCDHNCINTVGSYYCTCNDGYSLHTVDKHSCIDINECLTNNGNCDHQCYNTIGSYQCDCNVGYALHDDDHSCHDINECVTDNGGCDHTCVNEVGTYHCVCNVGFLLDEDKHGCSDHDECATNVHDCDTLAPATCHNTHGTFYCTCPIGFRLNEDGRTCDDVDECDEKSSGCTQICNNVYGSYFCTCHDGFSLDTDQHGCSDIDECDVADPCQVNCHNLIGSYYCSCNTGFQLESDDHTCVGIPCERQLSAPDNGGLECTGDQITGQSCTFSCRYGFELMGTETRMCQANGLWTGVDAVCQHLHCPELKDPKNGYVATPGCTTYFESECEVKCVDGYYVNGPSPHTETCSVNENNELFWWPKYTCQYIPPCQPSPCQHDSQCYEVTMNTYFCDCGDSLYTGLNCQTGVLSIGELPIMTVGETISIPIAGTPDNSVTLTVTVSSQDVNISQSSFTFDSDNPTGSLGISVTTPGVYSLSYSVTGEDADNYETPPTSVLIVIDPDVQHVENDYFLKTGNPVGILAEGCCSPGVQYQCPGGAVNAVSFSSNCAWDNLGSSQFSTRGVVFVNGAGISIPISLMGVNLMLSEDSYDGYVVPDLGNTECRVCDNLDPACNYFDFTPNDYLDLLRTRALETTFLKAIESLLPDWLSMSVQELDLTGDRVSFGIDDFTSYLTTGENIYQIPGCESLDLEPDSLFAVLRQDENVTVQVDGMSMKYSPNEDEDPVCIAVNLCMGTESPVHVTIPAKAREFINSYDAIQAYMNSSWSITFKELLLSDNGITYISDGDTGLSPTYWVGRDELVDSAEVVPNFEFRAGVDMKRVFWHEDDNLRVEMAFSGDMYHQSSVTGDDVEGVLSGDLSVSLNMTVEGQSGYMSLITTSTAALFTMPEFTSTGSSVPSGIAMKSTYNKHELDVMFNNILPIPEGQDTCPVDVFIALTADKEIDYIRLRTDCLNARVGGYLYTGNFVHDIYITGKSLPSMPEDVPATTVFAVFSYLGDQEIQLNEFYSIQQPISGDAALVCTFGRNAGSKSVTVTQAHLSILGTTFATSLSVTDNGIMFSSDSAVPLFGGFQAIISGTIPLGTSWDDFDIQLDGRFTDNPGSFVANVQDHVYDYTDSILESSAERIAASKMAEVDAAFAQAHVAEILAAKENELNDLLSSKNEAMDRYTWAMSAYNSAMDAYNTAMDSASDEALESVSLLKNICMAANVDWNQEGLPATYCKIMSMEQEILEWGLKKKMHTESRLIHSVREVTKLKWGIENYCQLVTLIRGWGNTMTAHRCSYIHTYDNITEEMLDAYHADVEIMKTEAAVTEMGSFGYCHKECDVTPWADSIPEAAQQYTSAACDVSRQPILESITNDGEDVVQAFLALEEAKRQLSAAEISMKTAVIAYNVTRDEYATLQSCMQYTDPNLASNIQTIQEEEGALQALQAALVNTDIQNLFSVISIQFNSGIHADTNTLPIDITYTILGNTRTLTTSIEFTATIELINRSIANALLIDVGSFLQLGNRKKRQATVESTFNENQFQTRCGQLNGITLYLEMIYDSLQTSYDSYMQATANISQVVDFADELLTAAPSDYPSIDFEYLKDNYNYEIDIATLNTQLGTAVPVSNRTAALQSLRNSLSSRMNGLQESYYRSWQNDLKKMHSMGLIDTVGHIRCYGVMDCLNLVHDVMKNLITDMPASTTKQEFLDALSPARMSLLKLVLYNSTLTLESALATNVTGMNSLVWSVLEEHYWCADVPTITSHPQAELPVHIGDTLSVECEASSVLPVTYSFEKNGFLVATGLSTGRYSKTATRYDSGLYQCIASNAVGSVQSTLNNVIVYMAPEITLSPSNYETFEGDENGGFFACNATSYPEPMYEWEYSKDGSSWVAVDNSKSNELIVSKPTEDDEGWYRCKVHTEGSGMVRSDSAYLSILRASFSQLSYSVSFLMNSTLYEDDSSGGNDEEFTPPSETVTIDYFRNQLNLTYTTVDDLHVDFSTDNKVIVVHVSMSVSMNYSATMPFDDQVDMAYMKKQDLMQGMAALQEHVKDGTFWFETEGTYYRGAHVSANLQDPVYSCPMNYILAYSNFICVTCSPGTYYNMVDGKGVCSVCPNTTYASQDGQTQCTSCPDQTDTLSTGSRWPSQCLDYCINGYYSKTGLAECTPCPNDTFTNNYKSKSCQLCTLDDVEQPECKDVTGTVDNVKGVSVTTVIIPSVIGGIAGLLVVIVLIVVVIVMVVKRKRDTEVTYAGGRSKGGNNPLYMPPQDVLSFVPETESTEYRIQKKEREIEEMDEDRDVVNPLYSEGVDENPYDDLNEVKAQLNN